MTRFPSFALAGFFLLVIILLPGITADSLSAADNNPVPVENTGDVSDYRDIIRTRWVGPAGSRPTSYFNWFADHGSTRPFQLISEFFYASASKEDAVKLAVFVNSDLYIPLKSALELFALDLTGEGYDVSIYYLSGGSPQSFRTFIQSKYAEGLAGGLIVGDLPVPWYEIESESSEFPCDLYYMDMDGIFTDADADGMFDNHTGDVEPEIYIGRLAFSTMTLDGVNEIDLLNDYFDKNHRYRCGLMPTANRALVYIDDDWSGAGADWSMNVGEAYGTRTSVYDDWTTWAPDYETRLPQDYEFIQVCVHSWSGGHGFKNPLDEWSWTDNWEIKAIQPTAHFYNLFACSNARYVENDYCAAWYILGQNHGLASIGSTKSGSMLSFGDFYGPLGEGNEIGEAYRKWFVKRAEGGFEEWEKTWFYGMTLCGDPTLKIQKLPANVILRFDNGAASYMMALPNPNAGLYNVRFTPEQPCSLVSVNATGVFPPNPVRMYIWNSDGTFPTSVIDSIDIPDGNLGLVDVSELKLAFDAYQNFHVGFRALDSMPAETTWIYMDDGSGYPETRSSLKDYYGSWLTLDQYYGTNYNFLIRAEVIYPDPPAVIINTLTIPDGIAGIEYDISIDVTGGAPPYSYELTAGTLPDGLTLDPVNGKLTGTPIQSGLFHFTVRATDSGDPALSDIQHLDFTFTYICGDVNSDGDVNVADAVYIINYVFKEGPAPTVPEAADANGDGNVDVADGVYLINYVFKNGPAPACR